MIYSKMLPINQRDIENKIKRNYSAQCSILIRLDFHSESLIDVVDVLQQPLIKKNYSYNISDRSTIELKL